MFQKQIVVDCRGHLLGRLAAVVAKEILAGQKIVCVRCEALEISGSLYRNKMKWRVWANKKVNTNHAHGQHHHRSPAKMFWRAVRGMIPHKTARGVQALRRLKVFNGIPRPYDVQKRQVVPSALRVLKLAPQRKFTVLGELAEQVGWTHRAALAKAEEVRKARSKHYYNGKKKLIAIRKSIAFVHTLVSQAP